jgi:hypothetical protein
VAVLVALVSATGCHDPQSGSVDLSKQLVGIEKETHEPGKTRAPAHAPKRP